MTEVNDEEVESGIEVPDKGSSSKETESKSNFPILRLPSDILAGVLEKLRFEDWVLLRMCSKASNGVCDSVRRRITLEGCWLNVRKSKIMTTPGTLRERFIHKVPWRQATQFPARFAASSLTINERLSSEKLAKVSKMCYYKEVTSRHLHFEDLIECSAAELAEFFELLDTKSLRCKMYLNPDFFNYPIAQKLTQIYLDTCRMTDKQFLSLEAEIIHMTADTISAKAINQYLKEWFEKKRKLISLDFIYSTTVGTRTEHDLFSGVPVNLIWSPNSHDSSRISEVSSQEIQELWSDDPRSFYCMWLSSDINERYLVSHNRSELCIYQSNHHDVFYDLLTEDQFYNLFHECRYCSSEFCEHRLRYSVPRFRRAFPRSWNGVMSFVRLSKILLNALVISTGDYNIFIKTGL